MLSRDVQPVLGAQQVLQQDLQAVGQVTGTVDGIQPVYLEARPADGEIGSAAEAVPGHGSWPPGFRRSRADLPWLMPCMHLAANRTGRAPRPGPFPSFACPVGRYP